MTTLPPSPRTTLRRHPERGVPDRAALHAILDEALVVHVAAPGPRVLPMAFGRIGDRLYLHGAKKNALLTDLLAPRAEVCVVATLLDGLVLARSAFHHSMNYRSAVIFGRVEEIEGEERDRALEAIVEHALPGRAAECRAPSEDELRATRVVGLDLAEASVKVRAAGASDAPADEALPHWTGVLPLREAAGAPQPQSDAELPASLIAATLARAPRLPGETQEDDIRIHGDPRRLDFDRLFSWLADAYWATDLTPERLLGAIQGSRVAIAETMGGATLGFARAVTDGTTFGWLADVIVAPQARGRGIGTALCHWLIDHEAHRELRRWMLGTRDAHRLYERLGFERLPDGLYMVRRRT